MQLQWKLENKVWNFTRLLPNKVNECQQDTIYFSPWNQSSIEVWTDWSTANTLQETVIIDLTKNQVEEMMICFRGATPTQKWKNLQKMAVTLTSQKSPLRVSLSLSHTHIGLPQGFHCNFPTSIPFTFIWEFSRGLPTTSAYKLGRFWWPPRSSHRGPRKEYK